MLVGECDVKHVTSGPFQMQVVSSQDRYCRKEKEGDLNEIGGKSEGERAKLECGRLYDRISDTMKPFKLY